MVLPRDLAHLILPGSRCRSQKYKPYPQGGGAPKPSAPQGGRPAHAAQLKSSLQAVQAQTQSKSAPQTPIANAQEGLYIQFESFPGLPLALESLESRRSKNILEHIELVSVQSLMSEDQNNVQIATVFVPEGKMAHFLEQLDRYALATPKKDRERRHEDVYDRIASIRLASLRALWTDPSDTYPKSEDEMIWWEVWLRRTDGKELKRMREFARRHEVRLSAQHVAFEDRIVALAYTSAQTLASSLDVMGDLAEVRRAKETAEFFVSLTAKEQVEWARELQSRTSLPPDDAPAVCVLDTGINRGHPLLSASLAVEDCHTCDPAWGTHDHHDHGTEMAGLALYGDLQACLGGREPVVLCHRLESVKVLPPPLYSNDPLLYGAITAEATSRPEIVAPRRARVFSMAVTTDECDQGQPSSWSAAIDALAAGRSFDSSDHGLKYLSDDDPRQRLFVVSAGNTPRESWRADPLQLRTGGTVQDPAQAWNALTVGAYTEKVTLEDPQLAGWSPIASRGELSPSTSTSLSFASAWPNKPDLVMEGGNALCHETLEPSSCDDLSVLTTYRNLNRRLFTTTGDTSAACAQVAWLCACIQARYPSLWPETVRALAVHSARWTPPMQRRLDAANKTERGQLLRCYGFGVPSLARALHSAKNDVALVFQGEIKPFDKGSLQDIQFHDLPWPMSQLIALGAQDVQMRVTLSYFIEPNPGRLGWTKKHRYQSHGLRFDVKGPTESLHEFYARLNQEDLAPGTKKPPKIDSKGWFLGSTARERGSLHSDILTASAADLAQRGGIAVFPVGGWWKEQPKRDRSGLGARYALVVSIETQSSDVDLWTPIAQQLELETPIELPVPVEV